MLQMLINLLKSTNPQWNGAPTKVKLFFRLVSPIITPSFDEIGWLLLQ